MQTSAFMLQQIVRASGSLLLESWSKVMYDLSFLSIDDLSRFVTISLPFPQI